MPIARILYENASDGLFNVFSSIGHLVHAIAYRTQIHHFTSSGHRFSILRRRLKLNHINIFTLGDCGWVPLTSLRVRALLLRTPSINSSISNCVAAERRACREELEDIC